MHQKFLLAALEQARFGKGSCAPNPSVGAVAVRNGEIIAQAWHRGAGTLHAEKLLLAQFPPHTPEITVYVTLEPCNHWGRTPPCVGALIEHGIERVVFAFKDPNPVVIQNNSTASLQALGIKVDHIPVPEITAFYDSYNYWTLTGMPRVTVKIAQSMDGKIAGPQGQPIRLSNAFCDEFTHQKRQETDIILTSSQTIIHDNPAMTVRLNNKESGKPIAIINGKGLISLDAQIFHKARQCIVYHPKSIKLNYPNSIFYPMPVKHDKINVADKPLPTSRGLSAGSSDRARTLDPADKPRGVGTMSRPEQIQIDLTAVLKHIGSLGFHDVWVEAGGRLFSALHQQGLVHRTYIYLVATSLGADAISAYQLDGVFDRAHSISWQAMDDNMIACLEWQEDSCLPD